MLHLIKLCVGAASLDDLRVWREHCLAQKLAAGEAPEFIHVTRQTPKQRVKLLGGGSLYWVINGFIEARQRIVDLRPAQSGDGAMKCGIVLCKTIISTRPQPRRPFQGWRYLQPDDAPPDAAAQHGGAVPPEMRRELAALGLL